MLVNLLQFAYLLQFVYLLLVGSFPFNSFLAGVSSCTGCFVLTGEASISCRTVLAYASASLDDNVGAVCLRMQIDPSNQDFKKLSPERAFADYVLCNAVLHLVIWNFMG